MQSGFFDAINFDKKYNSADFSRFWTLFIRNGVFADPASGMQVYSKGGLVLGVKPGNCFINGRAGYAGGDDSITLDYGDEGVYRYDAVVARLDLAASVRDIHIDIIRGDDAESFAEAVKPLPIRDGLKYDLILAYIAVSEGASAITDADIIDTRFDRSVCGIATGLVDNIDTTELFAQYQASWDNFIKNLGESDHITIDTADHKARAECTAAKLQQPYSLTGLTRI